MRSTEINQFQEKLSLEGFSDYFLIIIWFHNFFYGNNILHILQDTTPQAKGPAIKESHITFTDQTDYVDHGTVEADEDGKKTAKQVFKELNKVVEKTDSKDTIDFLLCDGCHTNTGVNNGVNR